MGTLSAFTHHEFTSHHALSAARATLRRLGARVWEAVLSTGPKMSMPDDEIERYVSASMGTEDAERRLRTNGANTPQPLVRN
ncbi:hypothetical protein [Niveibacterium sp. SC-1]|uniref:hypothetical protein n=1 Tax=Niveibacterium sp. SC-1 TaxID=3135646 RepID=UPI00311FFC33